MSEKTLFITGSISYPNGLPHIGHAYEAIASDALARFYRLAGWDIYFTSGTDDHGQKMVQTAKGEGVSAQALADRLTPAFKDMGEILNCTHDDFIRTCEPRHIKSVQALWRRIADSGAIYKDIYKGWYSVRDEAFYTGDEIIEGEAGQKQAPDGSPLEWLEEESYFFRLSDFQQPLLDFYEANPNFIQPESRRNEVIAFVKGGLHDLSISRTAFDWGVPVPDDPAHVVYVWLDALANYISVLEYPDEKSQLFSKYWDNVLHIIGKDIIRFHAVYWLAFLMAAKLPLPTRVFAHGFLTVDGEKMSKSLGNVLAPAPLAEHYGVDPLRYFFLREVPFGRDGSFSDEAIVNRVNADLANDLGNLAQRCLSMIAKNFDGITPAYANPTAEDEALLALFDDLLPAAEKAMAECQIHLYIGGVMEAVSAANRYFANSSPWDYKQGAENENIERMGTILYCAADAVRQAAILLQPVIPEGAGRLLDLLAVPANARDFTALGKAGRLESAQILPAPVVIFPRLEKSAS